MTTDFISCALITDSKSILKQNEDGALRQRLSFFKMQKKILQKSFTAGKEQDIEQQIYIGDESHREGLLWK